MTTTIRANRRSPGTTPQARERLVDALVSDAHRLLGHLPEQELGPRAAEAVALLALIAGQDVEPVEGSDGTDGRWRIAQQVAPDRVISTVDPDSPARAQDGAAPPGRVQSPPGDRARHRDHHRLRADQGQRRRQPRSRGRHASCCAGEDSPVPVLADSAYGSGEFRAELAERGHTDRVKPAPARTAIPGGFTVDDFTVDHASRHRDLPQRTDPHDQPHRIRHFRRGLRRLPAAGPMHPQPRRANLGSARTTRCSAPPAEAARDPDWQDEYRQYRPMVERTIAWLSAATAECATAASPKTTAGSTTEPPRSTCAD